MKSIKSALNRNRNRRSIGQPSATSTKRLSTVNELDAPPSPTPSTDSEATHAHTNRLDQYMGEIRRLVRESHEAKRREEQRERTIAELRRELAEAKARGETQRQEEQQRLSGTAAPPGANPYLAGLNNDRDERAETVEDAIKHLEGIIRRFSKANVSDKKAKTRDQKKETSSTTPTLYNNKVKNKKSVEIIIPPEFHSSNDEEALPVLVPSLHSSFASGDDNAAPRQVSVDGTASQSWKPAGGTSAVLASAGDDLSHSLYTAPSVDDTSSWMPAGAMAAMLAGADEDLSHSLYTAPSSADDTSSWMPAGTMAAMLAAADDNDGDGTSVGNATDLGSIADRTWMTAADDGDCGGGGDLDDDVDDDDMQTCVSALTLHTSLRSSAPMGKGRRSGGGSQAADGRRDESAAIVAELSRIQSQLCSILAGR